MSPGRAGWFSLLRPPPAGFGGGRRGARDAPPPPSPLPENKRRILCTAYRFNRISRLVLGNRTLSYNIEKTFLPVQQQKTSEGSGTNTVIPEARAAHLKTTYPCELKKLETQFQLFRTDLEFQKGKKIVFNGSGERGGENWRNNVKVWNWRE